MPRVFHRQADSYHSILLPDVLAGTHLADMKTESERWDDQLVKGGAMTHCYPGMSRIIPHPCLVPS